MSSVVTRSPPPAQTSSTVLSALAHRAEAALRDVTAAHHAFTSSRTVARHGALSLAVAHAQQLLKALEAVREQLHRQRQQGVSPRDHASSASSLSSPSSPPFAPSREELSLHLRLDKVRVDLRRVLPRAVAVVEEADTLDSNGSGGGGSSSSSSRSAASTAAALRSLLHTRSLLSVELKKMDSVVQGIAGSGESLAALHSSLEGVHSSMAAAQHMVRTLLTVQSRDDVVLRVSAVLFALAVLYVVAQRVFRFFPCTVYVTVDGDTNWK